MFTMARIKAIRGKGKEFFLNHLSCNDYYSEKERMAGVWHGRLAEDFGIANQTVSAEIFSLFQQDIRLHIGNWHSGRLLAGFAFMTSSVRLRSRFR